MHGAGVIDSIVRKKMNGITRDYYSLKLPVGSMMVLIPTDHTEEIGVRPVMEASKANEILDALGQIKVEMTANWNQRYRENMQRLKSGNLLEVAHVVKGLMQRDGQRGLSTAERKMFHSAKQILLSELVLSQDSSYEIMEERMTEALG